MNICGIISEYNPFHNGHALQIMETRQVLSPDCAVISMMSGNFVQRGDFALLDKYTRAKAAVLSGGPDLVLELPLVFALSSAEAFAQGGIDALNACGCVSHLSFGSESGNIGDLKRIAEFLLSEQFDERIKQTLKSGISYASARQAVLNEHLPDLSGSLSSPNNTLGIEYIKALLRTKSNIMPLTIRRIGANHDSDNITHNTASASYLRTLVKNGSPNCCQALMPAESFKLLSEHNPVLIETHEQAILSYLRRLNPDDFSKLPDASEGLENRLYAAAYTAKSLSELYAAVKTKRYAMSRIRRMVLCAYLGITSDLQQLPIPFIRVLAANEKGRSVLKTMKKTCPLPIITKPLTEKVLTGDAKLLSALDVLADDLYAVPNSGGSHWTKSPHIE